MRSDRVARLREARAVLRQGRLIAGALLRRPPRVQGDRVAVFIHGYLAAGPVFDPMRDHVGRLTGLSTLDFTYAPHQGFDAIVRRFGRFVRTRVPDGVRVSLVGHSLGGLVSRSYVHEHGGERHVDRVVTLATPHAGTTLSRLIPGPVRGVLHPESDVVRRLATTPTGDRVRHTAIVATRDRLVTPPESAAALPGAEILRIDVGHNEMLFDARVIDAVALALI